MTQRLVETRVPRVHNESQSLQKACSTFPLGVLLRVTTSELETVDQLFPMDPLHQASVEPRASASTTRRDSLNEPFEVSRRPDPLPQFQCCKSSSRNLVVCIDGTSNRFGIKNTNIVELYSCITKTDKQLTFYSCGLGAFAKVPGTSFSDQISNGIDMALGRNLHKIIMAAYRWLSDNYRDGDRIFLFGFSRGAYQVRALAGMIARVGLLLPGNKRQIPFAFELYLKTTNDELSPMQSEPTQKQRARTVHHAKLAKKFQKTFCRREVHIHFVGVWDTVSSVGFSRSNLLPCTTTPCEHICYFRHALALDERRVKFLPEYVYGGRSDSSDDGRIKEVWFPGRHSDVVGGCVSGGISLQWMRSQAVAAGLEMDPVPVMWTMNDWSQQIPRSMKFRWWLLEVIPFRRLLYYNSNKQTFKPHLGGPRRILPGQKVHASVLFMTRYKPYAELLDGTSWPESILWNDLSIGQRLHELSDTWEKEMFDKHTIQLLLLDIQEGRPDLDTLDLLIFMVTFDACKNSINEQENARRTLAPLLLSNDKLMRLSAAATFSELGWSWPSGPMFSDFQERIVQDFSTLLEEGNHRVYTYFPFLCRQKDLRARLTDKEILRKLVHICDSTRIANARRGTASLAAFRSAHALAMLMTLDSELAVRLIEIDAVTDLMEALKSNDNHTLVPVLNVLNEIAKHERGRAVMKANPTVVTLLRLAKQFDDFVPPAAIRVLCSLLPDDELRNDMLSFDVLSTFLELLDRCSDQSKQRTCRAFLEFTGYDDVRVALIKSGHLRTLAKQTQGDPSTKRDLAITALVALGNSGLAKDVTEAIKEVCAVFITRLSYHSTALPAALVLARFANIHDFAVMVSEGASGLPSAIVGMLQKRWFDGQRGEDGIRVLSELLGNELLRVATLRAGAIGALRKMIDPAQHESTYAALHYLRVVVGIGNRSTDRRGLFAEGTGERLELVSDLVKALRTPNRRVQREAMEIMQFFAEEVDLRDTMVRSLLDLLPGRQAGEILAASTVLGLVAADHEYVRARVLMEPAFCALSSDYYGGFNLIHDESGCPTADDVCASVGYMIRVMQGLQHEAESGAESLRKTTEQMVEDKKFKWPAREPYEIKKTKSRMYWIGMMLSYPALSPERRRKLWQEE